MSKDIEKIIKDIDNDRSILKNFLIDLINSCETENYVGIAEYVAKLSEALTRQHQTSIAAAKLVKVENKYELDSDSLAAEVGLPFSHEEN